MVKRVTSWSTASLVVALVAVTAVPASHAQDELPVIESADASHSDWGDSTVDINQVEMSEEGGYVTVAWTVNNEGETKFGVTDFGHDTYLYTDDGTAGVALVDEENGLRYNAVNDSADYCLCAGISQAPDVKFRISPGDSVTYWTSYFISEETNEVAVEVPGFEPVSGIPIE
ncbi:hypothetical protein F4561_000958 [Lipingzhangella halophila]|uniref:DUF4352 domain-containing protein n=1 Tax=Lipingzhangella halophila TaxID=1783352 RepID=A0A7W7RDT1_9ACTN|nr:hypothetical protein [Lipingzhangella halophila]MBB4930138.1 hypothetical protein [Lipingzhangella halophila]